MQRTLWSLFLLIVCGQLSAQTSEMEFVLGLAKGDSTLTVLVDSATLYHAERLGTIYTNVACKALIGYDLPPAIQLAVLRGRAEVKRRECGSGEVELTISESMDSTSVRLRFRQGKWISPTEWLTASWTVRESKYFRFRIEDPKLFSPIVPQNLDYFVELVAARLEIDAKAMELLEREKIDYLLCAERASIEAITGYNTRGMCLLGDDAVISLLPCHYHEIVHLLVNYRLQRLPLYTHPFLQEGIASALGGRDGKSAEVIADLGAYLLRSGYVSPGEVLAGNAFLAQDASLTYPVSAVLQCWLLDQLGADGYLKLYLQGSGADSKVRTGRIQLPSTVIPWERWLAQADFSTTRPFTGALTIVRGKDSLSIGYLEDGALAVRCPPGIVLSGPASDTTGFRSTELESTLPGYPYKGERLLMKIGVGEISVYDLYTSTMIAHWSDGLSFAGSTPVYTGGCLGFELPPEVLGGLERLEGWTWLPANSTGDGEE